MSISGKKLEVVTYTIPKTGKTVPIQFGDIKAAEGCFLAVAAVFEDHEDAKRSGYDQSRIVPQIVGAKTHPCYLFDCPFEHMEWANLATNAFKAAEKQDIAWRKQTLSLDKYCEDGIEFPVGYDSAVTHFADEDDTACGTREVDPSKNATYDPTRAKVMVNLIRQELEALLKAHDPRFVTIDRMQAEGYSAREISEATGIPFWSIYDYQKRIKKLKKQYMREE